MKILVGQHELKIDKKDKVNQNEYKVTKCEFEFDEAITNDLVKVALFTNSAGTYKQYIVNNECDIPAEILEKQETTTLGVYAYKEENEELELRYSPEEIKFYVSNGSYKEDAENTEPITPTDKEQMEQALQNGLNDINNKIDEVDEKLDGIETAIEETNNLNLDVSDKVDGDVTVTLTKKDASTKTVVLSDGTSLEFNWDGTKLGIKTSDEEEYTYVDLQGIQGPVGPQGEAFRIKKTYSSVAEMNADFNNMEYGDYVMIASSVEVEDNAKLYTRGESQWIFITDFSGSQGIKGETGLTPSIQIGTVVSGATPSVTRTGTDENPVLNFVLQKGDKGDKGNIGDTGNGISSIEKTSTSGLVDTYTITYTNGNTTTFNVTNGNGIDRIEKTATVGNKDTYTIYFTNGSTTTYEVSNGEVTREELEEEVDRLSMIYNAFPSTEGEVEEASINGTAEVPFKEIGLKGNTSQESTTQSANLFDENYYNNDSLYSINVYKNTKLTRIKQRGTLYFKAQLKAGKSGIESFYLGLCNKQNPNNFPVNCAWAIHGGTIVSDVSTIQHNYATFDENDDLYFTYYPSSTSVDTIFDTYNLLISTDNINYVPFVPNSPSPDYPIPVNVVTGDNSITIANSDNTQSQTYPINLGSMELCKIGDYQDVIKRSSGKNLLDRSACEENKALTWATGVTWNETGSLTSDFIKVNIGDKIYANYNYQKMFYDKDKNYLGCLQMDGTVTTGSNGTMSSNFVVPNVNGIVYMRLGLRSSSNPNINLLTANIMVNKGRALLNYEPYGKVWCKYGAIGKVVLDSTLSSVASTNFSNVYQIYANVMNISYLIGGFCDNFKFNDDSRITDNTNANNYLSDNQCALRLGNESARDRFYVKSTNFASANELKTYFNTNPTVLYYVLATPTITEITDTTLIEQLDNLEKAYSYDTQTNISQTNQDKPFIISYEAILSLKNVLNS